MNISMPLSWSFTLSLIRHGETSYNTDKTTLNHFNVPLTHDGCIQASHLIGHYDVVFVSPLSRTKMTYECSHITGDVVIYDDRIREYRTCVCDFIEGEDLIYETEEDILNRCRDFYDYLSLHYQSKKICVITHANWIKYFTHIMGVTFGPLSM